MILYLIILFSIYLFFLSYITYHWLQMPSYFNSYQPKTSITVIIPVRNEAANIAYLLSDLQKQSYPKQLLEIIVVNDHSTDNTVNEVEKMQDIVDYKLILLHLKYPKMYSGSRKKLAITEAIKQATGDLIVTTDGDCRLHPEWLYYMNYPFQEQKAVFVAGPVTFMEEKTFFQRLQTIEFASLIVTGAVSINKKKPTMCNGANLAYAKKVFAQVNGYEGNEDIASGDDEFLLQKISKHFNTDQIIYQKAKPAIVSTVAQVNWRQFKQQRRRWAGKWKKHGNPVIISLALFIFLFHCSFIGSFIYLFLASQDNLLILSFIFAKILLEFILLKNALEFLNKKLNLLKFIILQILYSFYVVYFGIAANFGTFNWKGRTYKS